ncbi:ATP-dependent Clp protease ATP-binding subunit ClpC1 [Rhodococcus fascians]|uniref:Clp protease N-terminal domain-containing protein n=1 Tax=Rhodococcoides fascians TaxID=1828 RepID=UPI001427B031|nr:ATP-dependent Clp protease ATP-binding subunit ClpC1 [Rhodococcus fascians]
MFERFTTQARAVVISARLHARTLHSERVEPIHLFLGALDTTDEPLGSALAEAGFTLDNALEDVLSRDARALRSIGIDLHDVIDTVETAVGFGDVDHSNDSHLPFAPSAKEALKLALKEAVRLRDREIGVEHMLLGVIAGADPSFTELVSVRGSLDDLRDAVLLVRTT